MRLLYHKVSRVVSFPLYISWLSQDLEKKKEPASGHMRNGWHFCRRCQWLCTTCCRRSTKEHWGHRYSSTLLLLNAEHESVKPKGFGSELSVETTNTGWSVSLRDVKTRSRKMHDWSLVVQPIGQPARTGPISPVSSTHALCLFWPGPPWARPSSPALLSCFLLSTSANTCALSPAQQNTPVK